MLRLALACTRADRHWHDEHYQTLEPAYYLVHGHGVLSWEWTRGFRSWALPLAHVPLVWMAKALGLGGLALTHLARAAYAALDVWAIHRWSALVAQRSAQPALARACVVATLGLLPTLALWGVSTIQDHLASIAFYLTIPTVFARVERGRPRDWLAAGALLALPVLVKLPLAPLSITVALALLFAHRAAVHPTHAGALFAGLSLVALGSALLDLATIGAFAASTVRQLTLGESLSRTYGTAPPWFYLAALPSLIGPEGLALLALSLVAALGHRALPLHTLPVKTLAIPALTTLVALSAIAHKEPRFVLVLVPIALAAIVHERALAALAPLAQRLPRALAIALALACAAYALTAARAQRIGLSDSDVSLLEETVRARIPRPVTAPVRLCLFGQHWSQMRGSLALDAPVRYVDAMEPSAERDQCAFAIVRETPDATRSFASSIAPRCRPLGVQQSHCALYRCAP